MARAPAGALARYLRDLAHVDTDRRQDLPGAHAARESLLEQRLPGVLARTDDSCHALRWPTHTQHDIRLPRPRAGGEMLGWRSSEHSPGATTGRGVLSGHVADAPRNGHRREDLDDAGRSPRPDPFRAGYDARLL